MPKKTKKELKRVYVRAHMSGHDVHIVCSDVEDARKMRRSIIKGDCDPVFSQDAKVVKVYVNAKQNKNKPLHILSVHSESGDDYGPFLFEAVPTDEELMEFLRENTSPDEVEYEDPEEKDGPGWNGTYLHLTWTENNIDRL
jgi:hypothetical protein